MSSISSLYSDNVVLRLAGPSDESAVTRLAQLDSAPAPAGPLWLAVLDGTPVAAYSTAERRAIADPWQPTAHLVELLELHAEPASRPAADSQRSLRRLIGDRAPRAA